ncbi:SEC1 family transport protein SLY1, partial [Haematococcus lacustris]
MVFNIRQKQSEAVQKLLNLNTALNPNKDPGEQYKVLVLDRFSRDIIAPLFRLNDLRRHGVTLHLSLEADRQAIPDVPAIYLVQPLPQHVDRIVSDAAAGLYETMHLNFTTSLPSRLLEQMAVGAVRAGASQRVAKVYDQYLSFVALEPTLFTLGLPNAYVELNDPAAKDSQIEAAVQSVVDGLFSVCVTLGVVPLIRCPCGGAAEHVAGQLDQKLRDALKARNNLFAEGMLGLSASLSRPLLCLFDRNYDLAAALQQPWTYKPMVHDVLAMHLNRIQLAPRNNLFAEGMLGLSASLSRPLLCLFDRNYDLAAALQQPWTYKPMVHDVLAMHLNRIQLAPELSTTGPTASSQC